MHRLWLFVFVLGLICGLPAAEPAWELASDTWTATDALGRPLPGLAEAGPIRPEKVVALFYFLWLGQHGEAGPFDISRILQQHPDAITNDQHAAWGPMYVPHHWGESLFGYYVSEDEAVLAKHAQMLADAGVDLLVFDVTNQLTYPRSWRALTKVFGQMRAQGNRTPQIAFLCPFWDPAKVARELYRDLYQPQVHPELWFRWQGRPLILADPDRLGKSWGHDKHDHPARLEPGHVLGQQINFTNALAAVSIHCPTWGKPHGEATLTLRRGSSAGDVLAKKRFTNISDNAWIQLAVDPPAPAGAYVIELSDPAGSVGWWSHHEDRLPEGSALLDGAPAAGDRSIRVMGTDDEIQAMKKFFTFRKPQPDYFTGPHGPDEWGWLEVTPQHPFLSSDGKVEEVAVGVAQNAVAGKLGVLSNPHSHGRSFHNGREPGPEGQDTTGRNFDEQWRRAVELDPTVVFVTGWNEWIAGRFDKTASFHGVGPVSFVDEFNQEFSRDIEPMRGGHGDNYYYQFVSWVRRFKGVRPTPAVQAKVIRIDGSFADWRAVEPEFRDTIGDPVHRDAPSWDRKQRYVNQTGRRDLISSKVSFDRATLSVFLHCAEPLAVSSVNPGPHLFLDVDGCSTNGWLGYDFRISIPSGKEALVERAAGAAYQWEKVGTAACRVEGADLELAVPWRQLGRRDVPGSIDFKWEDHCLERGEPAEFTLNGDAAPNDRFNYHAVLRPPVSR